MLTRIRLSLVATALASVFLLSTALAVAQAVTRAYTADTSLQRGMIVRLAEKDKTKVEALSKDDIEDMEGVVVAANDTPVTLSGEDQTKQQVFVATTGRYTVLVSDQGGPIVAGNYITISSLEGIGMKAGTSQSRVIGKAISAFDGKTGVSGTTTLKDTAGQERTLALGTVDIDITVAGNPDELKAVKIPGLNLLQAAARVLVGKPVDPARLYLGFFVLLLTAFITGIIIYSGVHSSLQAVGRNPLAKAQILHHLLPVLLTTLIVLILGIIGVYLILKL